MNPFEKLLAREPFIINDGALATQLEAMGADINDELWSAKLLYEDPESIKAVHASYFQAGADLACSASYQASVEGFVKKGFSHEEACDLIRRSARLACEARDEYLAAKPQRTGDMAADEALLVLGSCGPYGAFLADGSEYTGDYEDVDRDVIRDFHKSRMELLLEGGAQLFACETIPSLWEAQIMADTAAELGALCWISFSCKGGARTCNGTPIEECAEALKDHPAVISIGVNCTKPVFIGSLVERLYSVLQGSKPIVVFPNGGENYDPVTKTWSSGSSCSCGCGDGADSFKEQARAWYEVGARIIGGCCRTTPADIASLAELREELR